METINKTTELATTDIAKLTAVELFDPKTMKQVVNEITLKAKDFEADVNTPAGRKLMKSMARKVASSKTFLDGIGKDHNAKAKAQIKAFDTERKTMRDALDTLKDEVRQPLTEWEEKQAAKLAKIEAKMDDLKALCEIDPEKDSFELSLQLESLHEFGLAQCAHMEMQAAELKTDGITALNAAMERAEKREEDEAELRRLKQAEEDRLAAEAKEKAKAEIREEVKAEVAAERAPTVAIPAAKPIQVGTKSRENTEDAFHETVMALKAIEGVKKDSAFLIAAEIRGGFIPHVKFEA